MSPKSRRFTISARFTITVCFGSWDFRDVERVPSFIRQFVGCDPHQSFGLRHWKLVKGYFLAAVAVSLFGLVGQSKCGVNFKCTSKVKLFTGSHIYERYEETAV
jgi:hypothetical protein